MAPSNGKCGLLDTDISFEMERLFDHYNFDHIPKENRLALFKQRDLAHVKHYKAAVKIFGGPSRRTRAHVAPPMETLLKHRLGVYINVLKPPAAPPLNGHLKPPPVKQQTEEEISGKEEVEYTTNYNNLIAERKQLRSNLDNLLLNEVYLARKINKSEIERRVQAQYRANRLQKPEVSIPVEIVPPPKLHPDIPNMAVPPSDGLKILDKFLSLNHMRLMDLFLLADKNKNWSLSQKEFLNAVTQTDVPLTEAEVDAMFVMLDSDDKLSYQQLNKGLQLWRKQKRSAESQSDEETKKLIGMNNASEGHEIRATTLGTETECKPALKAQNKGIRDYGPASTEQRQKIVDSSIDSQEYYKEAAYFPSAFEKQSKRTTVSSHDVNGQEAESLNNLTVSPSKFNERKPEKSHLTIIYNGKNSVNKVKSVVDRNHIIESEENSRRKNNYSISEQPLYSSVDTTIFLPNAEKRVSSPNTVIGDSYESPLMNETLLENGQIHRNFHVDTGLQAKELSSAATVDKSKAEHPHILAGKDTFVYEARPGSHRTSSHSRTSTPNSLEPPPPDLRMEARISASMEDEVDIRKHDRVVLSRNKIRRQLTPDEQTAFDELPGVIKVGYKPIDDHCAESTLGGQTAVLVNQFRQAKLKEYFDVTKLFEQRGLPFTQKVLDRVMLYPGDQPTSELKGKIDLPVGQLTEKQSPFTKMKADRGNANWLTSDWKLGALDKTSGFGRGSSNNLKRNFGRASSGINKDSSQKKTMESGQRWDRNRKGHSYLTVQNVYPGSSVMLKVRKENLSSGKALISHQVNNLMTFQEYKKYTQHLPKRFHHKSKPHDTWPGYLLNKLRLYMDSDLAPADGHGRPLENRDSCAYQGYGTGVYNGRGNAVFQCTAQPRRAYPGYNNDLRTWPVGDNGVRYGNIDEHRLVK